MIEQFYKKEKARGFLESMVEREQRRYCIEFLSAACAVYEKEDYKKQSHIQHALKKMKELICETTEFNLFCRSSADIHS